MAPANRPELEIGEFFNIDGRPWFAKLSIDDGKKVEIAAIDTDFDRGRSLYPRWNMLFGTFTQYRARSTLLKAGFYNHGLIYLAITS